MKKTLRISVQLALIVALLFYSGCKNDDDNITDPEAEQLAKLSVTWVLGSVKNDNTDVTAQYAGFELSVNGDKTFSTKSGGNAWPKEGSFDFADESFKKLTRSDGIEVTILSLTDDQLSLSFNQPNVSGRVSGITGQFTFMLKKQ